MLHGIMYNSMKPQFKESAAIALAAADRYDWMNVRWLKVNEGFLASHGSAWKSIILIEQLMSKKGRDQELEQFRDAAIEYREFRELEKEKREPEFVQRELFSDLHQGRQSAAVNKNELIADRLNTYIEAADACL
jgi:hypothetical protein